MKQVDSKLSFLKSETNDLIEKCSELGDERMVQLLSEVAEMLDIAHSTFLGNALSSISKVAAPKHRKN
ncbi:hypothetical protein ISG33_16280 [Glaciecola sp. MH2013]|uniref:hypothetical protein n=1 Tax=Glaciecola sp. MH2013 TaxID=2785524 RepID=UPI00189F87BB|nr:hypothetical protein [Glaciecola sp. MH2013]MBF7074959.1 hypothetical protein [Glaciecola sp. MH2013]